MPCYCDTPDSSDQAKIENACKKRMYFHAQSVLTLKQECECEKRNLKQFPMDNVNDHLCKICKVLTEEQMKSISAFYDRIEWPHENLFEWHLKHCQDDIEHNGDER